jgi:hypothetical protein
MFSEDNEAAEQDVVVNFTPATPDIQPSPSEEVVFYNSPPNRNGKTIYVAVDEDQPIIERMENTEDGAHIVVEEPTILPQDENSSDNLVKAISLLSSESASDGNCYSGQYGDPVDDYSEIEERNLENSISAVDQVKGHDNNAVPEPPILKETENSKVISDADDQRAHVHDAERKKEKSIVDQINPFNKSFDDNSTHIINPSASLNNSVQDPFAGQGIDSVSEYRDVLSEEEASSVDQSQNAHSTTVFPKGMHEPSQGGAIHLEQADTTFTAEQSEDQNDTQVMNNTAGEESEPTATDDVSIDPQDEVVFRKRKHWQESPFAVGLVNPKWVDDRISCRKANSTGAKCEHFLSAYVCGCLGAGRVGNMAILAQRVEEYQHIELNEETGTHIVIPKMRPKPVWVVGPYWPVNWFLTFPLIFAISIWTAKTRVNESNVVIQVTYWMCILLLVFSLVMVACRNPGIMYRQRVKPEGEEGWRWNDQARTWRPPKARYDPECAVVVDGFDHT